jgi:hypothetical protein
VRAKTCQKGYADAAAAVRRAAIGIRAEQGSTTHRDLFELFHTEAEGPDFDALCRSLIRPPDYNCVATEAFVLFGALLQSGCDRFGGFFEQNDKYLYEGQWGHVQLGLKG